MKKVDKVYTIFWLWEILRGAASAYYDPIQSLIHIVGWNEA